MAAAPITRELLGNTFTFTTDCFSVTSSGGNVHRRYSPSELRDHFDAGEDRPAHWYEAQLRHYQLPPSKVKGTAKLRLLEAVRRGDLAVPGELAKLERDMRREWTRASKAGAGAGAAKSASSAAGQKKRKAAAAAADDDDDDNGDDNGTPSFHVTVTGADGRAVSVTVTSAAASSSSTPAKKPAAPKKGETEPKIAAARAPTKIKTEPKATPPPAAKKVKAEPKAATSSAAAPAAKKIKQEPKEDTTPVTKKKPTPKKPAAVPSPHPAEDVGFPPRPEASDSPRVKPRPDPSSRKQLAGRTKQTARKTVSSSSALPAREAGSACAESSASASRAPHVVPKPPASSRMRLGPRTKQTARKSATSCTWPSSDCDSEDENDNRESYDSPDQNLDDCNEDGENVGYDKYDDDDDPPPPYPGSPRPEPEPMDWTPTPASSNHAAAPLGLLNGRYEILSSDTPPGYRPDHPARQTMTLTLDGDALWMWFNLGFLEGVGRTDRRPYETSRHRTFGWFGHSVHYRQAFAGGGGGGRDDGAMDARLDFVGGGVVRGEVEWVNRQTTCFEARRLDGQGTRSDISSREMRDIFERLRAGVAL
ncbi:hypothetical protein PpBr36_07564 [Pyricularia pennisetigena]|uniref:hypothetical protein n=1 Tax=Pyricularia pennisetigena TaxID=1578925 RepID=UPI0011503BA2|nr:hypothetical protein PpBr36_07564 [Pyricularia pennisetigena]TLS25219.1 hypothetical protein PpBr36_07564 [Pyricularia pennisetigena]